MVNVKINKINYIVEFDDDILNNLGGQVFHCYNILNRATGDDCKGTRLIGYVKENNVITKKIFFNKSYNYYDIVTINN